MTRERRGICEGVRRLWAICDVHRDWASCGAVGPRGRSVEAFSLFVGTPTGTKSIWSEVGWPAVGAVEGPGERSHLGPGLRQAIDSNRP